MFANSAAAPALVLRFHSYRYFTVTTAFISGWNVQLYGKLPASVKVCCQDLSGSIEPESNNEADVAVCGVMSSLVHSTVWPGLISTDAGENFMLRMMTCTTVNALGSVPVL